MDCYSIHSRTDNLYIEWFSKYISSSITLERFIFKSDNVHFGAFYEEILIRGYLLTRLYRSGLNIWISLSITSLIFSALHLANPDMSICSVVNLFLGGFFDGCIFLLTGSLWTAVISHCAWNWLQGSIFGFNVSGGEFYQSLITLEYPSYNLIMVDCLDLKVLLYVRYYYFLLFLY